MLEKLKIRHRLYIFFGVVVLALLISNVNSVLTLRSSLLADRQAQTRTQVETATGIVEHFHARQLTGELSEEAARKSALAVLEKLRYDQKEYFWVNDLKAITVMHPIKPELNGKDMSDIKDSNGKTIFAEFAKVANASGSGFVDYFWPKPGHDQPVAKVSYVRLFQPWGWVIGTGIYIDDVDATARQQIIAMLLFGLVVLASLSVTSWRINGSILRQIGGELTYAVSAISRIAAGDLAHPIKNSGHSTSLLSAVSGMQDKLAEVVQHVDGLSQRLASQAEAVACTSSQLGAASLQQAEATSQSAAAIEQLTVSIGEVAEIALLTESNSGKAVSLSEEGSALINSIAREIELVAQTVTQSSEQIKTLEQRSQDVGGIANVIKEIADQTNLLALNAAIEAARAGEQGRGFAVVADEVRKLAERTAQATAEIADKIAAIQSETQTAVVAMQEAVPQVQKGLTLTSQAIGKLDDIHTQAGDSLARVRDVANASQQQTMAATDIARNVEHIAAMAEEANAAMTQNAESAHNLERMSDELRQAIDYFHTT